MPEEDSVPPSIVDLENSTGVAPRNSTNMAPPNTTNVAPPNSTGVAPPNTTRVAPPNFTNVTPPNITTIAPPVIMDGTKEKVPKFDGDGTVDPIRHYKTCEAIWTANGVTNTNEWVQLFSATLRGIAIDWFTDTDP